MRIIVTGGGTGGHIYPVVAIAKKLMGLHENCEILYIGSKVGIESEIAPKEGLAFKGISAKGFTSKKPLKLMEAGMKNAKGVWEAIALVKSFKPDLIIGSGGYASAPVVFAGGILGIKVVIHEQNAFPGKANLFLAKWATKVFTSYEEAAAFFPNPSKVMLTGNPVRESFKSVDRMNARKQLGMQENTLQLLSFGGSGGAKRINELVLDLMKHYNRDNRIVLHHVTGSKYHTEFLAAMKDRQLEITTDGNLHVDAYLHDIPNYLAASDLVICRSGATTLAELQAVHTPSILIPSPNVKDNHQEHNARSFEKNGTAVLVTEWDLSVEKIVTLLEGFMSDPEELSAMRACSMALDIKDPLDLIYEEICGILGIECS